MRKTLVSALILCLGLSGCGYFGEKPAPAPVVEIKPEPAPPPPPPPPPPLTHTVRKGESVASIAKKYGVPATQVLAANNLPNAKALKAGKVITIPGKTAPDVTKAKPEAPVKEVKEIAEKPVKGSKNDPFGIDAALAPAKGKKGAKIKVDDDATYDKIKADFRYYAVKWLQKSAALSQSNKSRKDVAQESGRYVASYNEILLDTVETEVKRVDYPDTPYVAHITYRMRVHRTYGPTPQAAQASGDEEVKEENMREIFSFNGQKRVWR